MFIVKITFVCTFFQFFPQNTFQSRTNNFFIYSQLIQTSTTPNLLEPQNINSRNVIQNSTSHPERLTNPASAFENERLVIGLANSREIFNFISREVFAPIPGNSRDPENFQKGANIPSSFAFLAF